MSQYDLLRAFLSDRVIAFHPRLAVAFGGVNEALIFQQLAYWSERASDPEWVYKTQQELQAETTLTRTQQDTARKRLRALGVIEEERRGMPARLYFHINWERVFDVLGIQDEGILQSRVKDSRTHGRGKAVSLIAGIPHALTEMTTEKTKENQKPRTIDELIAATEASERIDNELRRRKRAGFDRKH